jgi:hypothetical protein
MTINYAAPHPAIRWVAMLWFVAALLTSAPGSADHLMLGNEGIYPPFSIVDSSGKLTGIEPDGHAKCASASTPAASS